MHPYRGYTPSHPAAPRVAANWIASLLHIQKYKWARRARGGHWCKGTQVSFWDSFYPFVGHRVNEVWFQHTDNYCSRCIQCMYMEDHVEHNYGFKDNANNNLTGCEDYEVCDKNPPPVGLMATLVVAISIAGSLATAISYGIFTGNTKTTCQFGVVFFLLLTMVLAARLSWRAR